MRTIEKYIDLIDVLDDAGIDHAHEDPIELVLDVPVTVLGRYSPAIMWGDHARPAEYPETEADMDPDTEAMKALGQYMQRGDRVKLNTRQKHDFLEAASALIDIEIGHACDAALED